MGSVMSHVSLPGTSPYAMSKHAVRALAASLRNEWRSRGVAVTLLAPGFVDSEIRQVGNDGQRNPDAGDSVPRWLRMRTDTAARKMVTAVVRRKREAVITFHGKVGVFLARSHARVSSTFWFGSSASRVREGGNPNSGSRARVDRTSVSIPVARVDMTLTFESLTAVAVLLRSKKARDGQCGERTKKDAPATASRMPLQHPRTAFRR